MGGTRPAPVFYFECADVHLHHLRSGGVTFRDPASGACDGVYVMQNVSTGRVVLGNLDLYYGGNHIYGSVHDVLDNYMTLMHDFKCQQGPPWTNNSSGFTALVEHTIATNGGNRRAYFVRGDWSIDSVVGSAAGVETGGLWYCHDASFSGDLFSAIRFRNCRGAITAGERMVQDWQFVVEQGIHRYVNLGACRGVIRQCLVTDRIAGQAGGLVEDCVVRFENTDLVEDVSLAGDWSIRNCVLDARQVPNRYGRQRYPVLKGAFNLQFSSNLFLLPQDGRQTVAFALPTTNSTNLIENNTYLLGSSNYVAILGTNPDNFRTRLEWQQMGYDSDSVFLDPVVGQTDTDGDGLSDLDELRAGTDPNDADSCLRLRIEASPDGRMSLVWASVPNRIYSIECGNGLDGNGALLGSRKWFVFPLPPLNHETDEPAPADTAVFYRLRAE